ncbi:MAG TPA: DUF309 domain-containing protein [Geobacterales bacterium]|nr:DUF309 domain-containing protein [Geobacterales bacterium]
MNKRIIVIAEKNNKAERKELASIIKANVKSAKLNDIRIATKHVEIDMFSEDPDLTKIELSKYFKINELRILTGQTFENIFETSKKFFNEERFWEVHEMLENIWRNKKGDEKKILHGLILLAAAFVHHQKNRNEVALSILKRSYEELKNYSLNYNGFDISLIKKKMAEMIEKGQIEIFKIT